MKQLAAWVPTWEEVRDQEVLKTGHEAAIELRHLVEIQKLKEARREVVARQLDEFGESSQDLTTGAAASSALLQRAQTVARRLGQLAILWGILLAVAGDLGTLLAVHQWMRHRNVVRTVEPVLREFRSLGEELAANAHRQEEVRRRPELRYIELTLAGY